MSDSYYIRIRGRVHGPMQMDRLTEMASKGQLSRTHEMSQDGKTWSSAAKMPEIFERQRPIKEQAPTEDAKAKATPQATAQPASMPTLNGQPQNPPGVSFAKEWHYAIGTVQMGPVSTSELIELIRHRSLARDNIVWKEGMPQWTQAGYVPELVGAFSIPQFRANASYSGPVDQQPKSKSTAILLALLLGSLGIHHFYLGNTLRGILMLVLLFLFLGILVNPIVALIETIMIAVATEEDFQQKWTNKGMSF